MYAMAHQSLDGRFRISPVDCQGRAIAPEVLSAAYEISARALSHAEKVLNDPAVALSAFEETAATVSRMLSKQQGSGNIRNLPGYLFRAFLRQVDRLKRRELLLSCDRSATDLLESYASNAWEELELKVLVDELLTKFDAVARDMFYRRQANVSWEEIGRTYNISAHAAELRFRRALRRLRKRLGAQLRALEKRNETSASC